MEKKNNLAASDMLQGVVNNHQSDRVSFADLKTALHERGFGLLMLIFALPISLPLPLPPGATFLPALPLILFSVQMIMGMDSPWLPKYIGEKSLKRTTLAFIIEKAAPYLKKIERHLKPRFSFASSRTGEKIIGLAALIFSICIMIPLPFTQMVPAMGISIMSLGLLSKDGITIVAGMVIGMIGAGITTIIIILGEGALTGITNHIAG
jgi:hypothetical protein